MTLIKSLLLGSAAGLVAVAGAQAADLPTHKGPVAVDYVRICSITVAGTPVVGFILPGSDTCFKISGYLTAHIEGGNVKTQYNFGGSSSSGGKTVPQYSGYQTITPNGGEQRDTFGYTTRFNLAFDAVSNTAYGPLVAHAELQFNHGGGYANSYGGSDGGLNRAYVTWAGLTAGKIDSFFAFTGGGLAWDNFFSPDRRGFDEPDVLAYTASFGGGFSATISIEDPYNGGGNGASNGTDGSGLYGAGNGSYMNYLGSATEQGMRIPDVVGSLDVKQAWGTAHVAGVLHNIRADGYYYGDSSSYSESYGSGYASLDKFGYAVDAGVSFNIPNMAGSVIAVTGSWSQNATRYGGLPDGLNGDPGGQSNGNGQYAAFADAFLNGNGSWATPTSWSVTAWGAFQVTPQVNLGIEGSYGENTWSGKTAVSGLYDSKAWLIGGIAHYDPVKNLDFEFELLYENLDNSTPTGYLAGSPGSGETTSWQGKSDGFQARMEVTRNF